MTMKIRIIPSTVAAALLALAAGAASATTTLTIETAATPGTFGRTGGVAVDFSSTTGGTWSTQLVDGTSYFVDSVTFTKNNAVATFPQLWIGVYSSFTSPNSPSGFLGASSGSVAWGEAAAGTSFTWNFSDVIAAANPGSQLILLFQDSPDERTNLTTIAEGDVAVARMPGETGSLAGNGAAIIHGNATQGIFATRAPLMELSVTPVPEPGTTLLGALGALALLRRRR